MDSFRSQARFAGAPIWSDYQFSGAVFLLSSSLAKYSLNFARFWQILLVFKLLKMTSKRNFIASLS